MNSFDTLKDDKDESVNKPAANSTDQGSQDTENQGAQQEPVIPDIQPLKEHTAHEGALPSPTASSDDNIQILDAPDTSSPEKANAIKPPLNEIAPSDDDIQSAIEALDNIPAPSREKKQMTEEELEELASRLATARVESMKHVSDPFEAWENARADILQQIKNSNNINTTNEG